MCAISANGTDRKDGGNQEQGSDVQGNWFFSCVFVSTANNKAAICEQASPKPAMQVQCAHKTSPCCLVATQTFNGGAVRRWECFTNDIIMKTFVLVAWLHMTSMFVTQPLTKKL